VAQQRRHHNRSGRSSAKGRKDSATGFMLTIQDGRQRGEEYFFESDATVGRTDENSIILIDDSISRRHSHVFGKRGVFMVEDAGSSNGTRLNGKILGQPEVLKDGDYITCGTVNLMFTNIEADAAGDPTVVISLTDKQKEKLDTEIVQLSLGDKVAQMWGNPRGRLMMMASAILVALLLGGLLLKVIAPKKNKVKVIPDQSEFSIDYREANWGSFLENFFGQCSGCMPHKSSLKLVFQVAAADTRVVLSYAAGMIEKDKEVDILLNGARVRYAEWAPPNQPKYNFMVDLYRAAKQNPKIKLNVGENTIEFRNLYNHPDTRQGDGNEEWVVFYVRIKTTQLPKPNLEKASEDYSLAKQRFEQRELNPTNYREALIKFYRVIDLLELAELEKPENGQFNAMYKDSSRTIGILNRELDHLFEISLGKAQELARTDDVKEMKRTKLDLQEKVENFPPEDPRRQKLELIIRDLSE